jgi:hypothetical protein
MFRLESLFVVTTVPIASVTIKNRTPMMEIGSINPNKFFRGWVGIKINYI